MDYTLDSHGFLRVAVSLLTAFLLVEDTRRHTALTAAVVGLGNESLRIGIAALVHKVFAVRVQTADLPSVRGWLGGNVVLNISFLLTSLLLRILLLEYRCSNEDMGVLLLQLLKHFGTVLRLR